MRALAARPRSVCPPPVAFLALALTLVSCAGRRPVLEPPAGVEAVEGHGSAFVQGEETALKGKFSFVFRKPGRGRVDVPGPFGTTAYFMIFDGGTARLVVPSRKIYAEESSTALMGRFLGFELGPDEVLGLLSGHWPEGAGGEDGRPAWTLTRDDRGHVIRGERGGFVFEVSELFPGTGVPRSVRFSRPGSSGQMKVLSLRFNPADRPEAFATGFLGRYARRTWDEMQDILKNER